MEGSAKIKHTPQRSCLVCRAKTDKKDLIRIVRSPDGEAVIDVAKKLPGRGTYICPDRECIERAKKSGALSHALGVAVNENFWPELLEHAENFEVNENLKLRSLLGLARKSGTLLIGTDKISSSRNKILVLCAKDCSERVREFAAKYESITLNLNTEELSEAAGSRGGVQVTALPLSSGFAKRIMSLKIERGTAI